MTGIRLRSTRVWSCSRLENNNMVIFSHSWVVYFLSPVNLLSCIGAKFSTNHWLFYTFNFLGLTKSFKVLFFLKIISYVFVKLLFGTAVFFSSVTIEMWFYFFTFYSLITNQFNFYYILLLLLFKQFKSLKPKNHFHNINVI